MDVKTLTSSISYEMWFFCMPDQTQIIYIKIYLKVTLDNAFNGWLLVNNFPRIHL